MYPTSEHLNVLSNYQHVKVEIVNNAILVGDFNIPLSTMDRSSRQKINKEIIDLNYTLEQMNLMDIYRTFHPTTGECTFISRAHGTFPRVNHVRPQTKS